MAALHFFHPDLGASAANFSYLVSMQSHGQPDPNVAGRLTRPAMAWELGNGPLHKHAAEHAFQLRTREPEVQTHINDGLKRDA
jgi:hypothetical protein